MKAFLILLVLLVSSPAFAGDGRWTFEKEWELGESKVAAAHIGFKSGLQLAAFCDAGAPKLAFATTVREVTDALKAVLALSTTEYGADEASIKKLPTASYLSKDNVVFVIARDVSQGDTKLVLTGIEEAKKRISVTLGLAGRSQKFNFPAKGSTMAIQTFNQRCSK